MKKIYVGVIVLVSLLIGGLLVQPAFATRFMSSDNGVVQIRKDEVVDSAAFLAGSTVLVDGTVKGDVYCAGQAVTITGVVEGDVLCAAQTITITGSVSGNVRVAAQQITIGSTVNGSVSAAAAKVSIGESAKIDKDLTVGASEVLLNGTVARDVHVGASIFTLQGTIGRDVTAAYESASFGDSAKVGGVYGYRSGSEQKPRSGVVAGEVRFTLDKEIAQQSVVTAGTLLMGWIVFLLSLLVLGLVVVMLLPKFVHEAAGISWRNTAFAGLIGLGVLVLGPVVLFTLLVTGIGAWAAFTFGLLWLVLLLLALPFSAYFIGLQVLREKAKNAVLVMALGLAILAVASFIPLINGLVILVSLLVGVGMQVMMLRHQFDKKPYTIVNK